MVKYCPLCEYCTSGNKIARHITNKHKGDVQRPTAENVKAIVQIITKESRKSYTLVSMSAIEKKLGPYWVDPSFRSIAHGLTVMGRMKVYGGHWNLPGVRDLPNPFSPYLKNVDQAIPIHTRSVQEPAQPAQPAREVTPPHQTVADTSSQ